MDVPRLAVIGGSVVLAALVVLLASGGTGPTGARRVLQFWTVVTFLVVGLALWAMDRR